MDKLIVEQRGSVAVLVLNEPARRNPLSLEMRDQLMATLSGLVDDSVIRVIVLRGAGGEFCSGGDIHSMANTLSESTARERMILFNELSQYLLNFPKPVIAAVEGHAFGAGMSLALLCDHVIARKDARFCSAFARVGLLADMALLWSLTQRVGMTRAKQLIVLAEEISGVDAAETGIINDAVEPLDFEQAVADTAARYAALAPAAFAAAKSAFTDGSVCSLISTIAMEAKCQPRLRETADHKQAVKAFLEKRAISFEHRDNRAEK